MNLKNWTITVKYPPVPNRTWSFTFVAPSRYAALRHIRKHGYERQDILKFERG